MIKKKKIISVILLSSILATQCIARICTEEQYTPYFTDKKEKRYIKFGITNSTGLGVIDKKSIRYNKKKNIIETWTILQYKEHRTIGKIKTYLKFNTKTNQYLINQDVLLNCDGTVISTGRNDSLWEYIVPNSMFEICFEKLKEILKIK